MPQRPLTEAGTGTGYSVNGNRRTVSQSPENTKRQPVPTIGGRGKELRPVLRRAVKPLQHAVLQSRLILKLLAGWIITRCGSGHLRWVSPDGHIVTTSSTPSGAGVRCALVQLRKAGL